MSATDWMATAAAVQACATVVLVAVTVWYAARIKEQADAAAEAADATKRSAKATKRLAELTAPEVRAGRADALAQIRELAEALYARAQEVHRVENVDVLTARLGSLDSEGLMTSSQRRRLERLGARVGGTVREKVWTVCEAADEFRNHRQKIDPSAGHMRDTELTEEDLRGYRQRARNTRRHLTELRDSVDHALEELNAEGDPGGNGEGQDV